jgi:hypothetical protein
MQTCDSNEQTALMIGSGVGATAPTHVTIRGITLRQGYADADVFLAARVDHLTLDDVGFSGQWTAGSGNSSPAAGLRLLSGGTAHPIVELKVSACRFSGVTYGIATMDVENGGMTNDTVTGSSLQACEFADCYSAIVTTAGVSYMNITGSTFTRLDGIAIQCSASNGVVSAGSRFTDVAQASGIYAIYWDADTQNCGSVADGFVTAISTSIYDGHPGYNIIVSSSTGSSGTAGKAVYGPVLLLDASVAQASPFSWDVSQVTSIIMDYSMVRYDRRRLGQLQVITDGTTASIVDMANELGTATGISWGYTITGTAPKMLTLTYTTTSTGWNIFMKYTQTTWLA